MQQLCDVNKKVEERQRKLKRLFDLLQEHVCWFTHPISQLFDKPEKHREFLSFVGCVVRWAKPRTCSQMSSRSLLTPLHRAAWSHRIGACTKAIVFSSNYCFGQSKRDLQATADQKSKGHFEDPRIIRSCV